jgi:hypothetical protein
MLRARPTLLWCLALLVLSGCSRPADDPAGFGVAFEDQDAGRLAVCGLSGRGFHYITPDTLVASSPVTDSTHGTLYFLATRRADTAAFKAIYAVTAKGDSLRKLSDLPLSVLDLQVTPDASRVVFLGRYADSENVHAYLMRLGETGFQAVTPAQKSVHDPAMAPGGLNFVWQDGTQSDTLFVSSLQETLTLPIFKFPYTQVSLRWPDGRAFAAIGGAHRRGLYHMLLQKPDGEQVRMETELIPEQEGILLSDPVFHPDGDRILYVQTSSDGDKEAELRVIDRNSLKITRLPVDCTHPTHPVWCR